MKKRLVYTVAAACCFIFLMAISVTLDGRWTGSLTTPDGNEIQAVYNFKVDGNVLTGTAESPEGMVPIDSGRVDADTFSFSVTVDGNAYPHKGKIYDDSCGVDVDFGGGQWVHETLVRDTTK